MITTKLYYGSVVKVLDANGNSNGCLKAYEYLLRIKANHKFSYIYNYKANLNLIAKRHNVTPRTFDRWVNKSIAAGYAWFEGNTLRLLSDTQIKEQYATKKNGKYHYDDILVIDSEGKISPDLKSAIDLAPLQRNINTQYRSMKRKQRSAAKKPSGCQSNFTVTKENAPQTHHAINEDVLISQKKMAELLGYRSYKSGYNALRRLQARGIVDVRSNMLEITREDYNLRKIIPSQKAKLLIRGLKSEAKFFYCLANSVFVTKPFDRASYRALVDPRLSLSIIDRYSVTTSRFLDNY